MSSNALSPTSAEPVAQPACRQTVRLAVFRDFAEENWTSMDLCGQMLVQNLQAIASTGQAHAGSALHLDTPRPPWRGLTGSHNLNRLYNRMWNYPRFAGTLRARFDAFHVVDHSYSQLVLSLPGERTGVFCHDIDTFRSVVDPQRVRRGLWFRAMTRRILRGFQSAALVFYSTNAVRAEIERFGLVDPSRLVHAPLGVAPEFFERPPAESLVELPADLAAFARRPYVLHVGSCVRRKRIDVLLNVVRQLQSRHRDLGLIQVGGTWTDSQRRLVDSIPDHLLYQTRGISRTQLAALYRGAKLVLFPSEAEGFGLPTIEALATGATIIASDLPVLREVGGDAVIFCPTGDVPRWVETVQALLEGTREAPSSEVKAARAARFSWDTHAAVIAAAYRRLVGAAN